MGLKYLHYDTIMLHSFQINALLVLQCKTELIYFHQLVSQHQTVARDFKSSNRSATGV